MALNKANEALIDQRRRLVASLLLRKLTRREIMKELEKQGLRNPDTGEPYALATVQGDIKALQREWRKEAQQNTGDHMAQILAELQEVKRAAWAKGQLFNVLRAIDTERDILGLTAAVKMKVEIQDWRSQAVADIRAGKLPFSVLAEVFDHDLATELFKAAGVPVTG